MNSSDEHSIRLRGVRVHNLKNIDVDIPLHKLTVVTGLSGSGKSSLAFDTLYAEGQRRYIETFSAYARQYLDQIRRPDADHIEAIPPAIAIRQHRVNLNGRTTVGTATEIYDYLRLLFARVGSVVCPECDRPVRRDSPQEILERVAGFAEGTRFQIVFPPAADRSHDSASLSAELIEEGFTRLISGGATVNGHDAGTLSDSIELVVVDRLLAGRNSEERTADSVETALRFGEGRCVVLEASRSETRAGGEHLIVDEREWRVHRFDERLVCGGCGREFEEPEAGLFSFNSPRGACARCEGFGSVTTISFGKLVPDPSKTLREGAIAAWTTPAYRHELDELLSLADDHDLPVDIPFAELEPRHLELILGGVRERDFGGLQGFFRWLERHRYRTGVRVFLNRWRAWEACPECRGRRLRPEALCVRVAGHDISGLCSQTIGGAIDACTALEDSLPPGELQVTAPILSEILARLGYLQAVGLGYLTLERTMRTLSRGEAQRVALTSALGSSLVNTLYVLDEPSTGLHSVDTRGVLGAILRLRDAGNTVVVVEHEAAFVRAADCVIEIGPGAGRDGGEIVLCGSPAELEDCDASVTAKWLADDDRFESAPRPRTNREPAPSLRLSGVRHHNLKGVSAEFPLHMLCVVTGVSGSGKSSLIHETLYPAVCRELGGCADLDTPGRFDVLEGADRIRDVVMVDQQPVGRTPRSIPETYLKAFDEIRRAFAETQTAKQRNYSPTTFSFNSAQGGRCPKCEGHGTVMIDMQFLADVTMVCPECNRTRFRREVLDCRYRGLTIADVLTMSVDDAFSFFRAQPKLQRRLKFLKDVGLGYVPLGQPATELSGGESQRLKLAAWMAGVTRTPTETSAGPPAAAGCLFLFDEPTSGLHAADIETLLSCFHALLDVGHSLIVIEHNLQIIRAADHIIDLGPGAGEKGGTIVAAGPPEKIRDSAASATGRVLRGE